MCSNSLYIFFFSFSLSFLFYLSFNYFNILIYHTPASDAIVGHARYVAIDGLGLTIEE